MRANMLHLNDLAMDLINEVEAGIAQPTENGYFVLTQQLNLNHRERVERILSRYGVLEDLNTLMGRAGNLDYELLPTEGGVIVKKGQKSVIVRVQDLDYYLRSFLNITPTIMYYPLLKAFLSAEMYFQVFVICAGLERLGELDV